ncbi:MAG: hypothetical protein RL308_1098 [Bacteroidota bacterium]
MELDNVSKSDNLLVMNKLNSRTRKIYGFKTPNYLFSKYIHEKKLAPSILFLIEIAIGLDISVKDILDDF